MSQYPRLLSLGPNVEARLVIWLDNILSTHIAERGDFINELIENQKLYWAEPEEVERKFPFKGAANIIIPIAAISFETVHANNMQQFRALEQVVNVTDIDPQWSMIAPKYEKFINRELVENIKFFEQVEDAIIDLEKHGTGVAKAGYEKLIKWGVRETPAGDEEFPVVVKQGAFVQSVPLYRYLMPFSSKDSQSAPWCGEEHEDELTAIYDMERSGLFFEGITEDIKAYLTQAGASEDSAAVSTQQELDNRRPIDSNSIKWYEIWCSFDVDHDEDAAALFGLDITQQIQGEPKEVILYFHRESRKLMGARYNPYYNLRRPYRHGVYFPIEHRWRGVGICKQSKMFQYEITAQHRQRLDNATIANMRMFKISKVSGYGPGEPIFPGKMWFVDDMDHIDTLQVGEVYGSSFNNEATTLQYVQQRVGVTDIMMGMSEGGTPGTATDIMARVKEGRKRYDYTNGNVRTFLQPLILDLAAEIQQYGPRNIEYLDTEDGQEVRQALDLPSGMIGEGLVFQIRLADEQNNDLVERNNWTQVAGLMQQYITGAIQLSQLLGDPMITQEIARSGLIGATMAFKQVLQSYSIPGVDRMYAKGLLDGSLIGGGAGITPSIPGSQQGPGGANPGQGGGAGINIPDIQRLLAAGNSGAR